MRDGKNLERWPGKSVAGKVYRDIGCPAASLTLQVLKGWMLEKLFSESCKATRSRTWMQTSRQLRAMTDCGTLEI